MWASQRAAACAAAVLRQLFLLPLAAASSFLTAEQKQEAQEICNGRDHCTACVTQWDGFSTCQWCPGQGCLWSGNEVNCGGLWVYKEPKCMPLDQTIQNVKRLSQDASAQCGAGCITGIAIASVVVFFLVWAIFKYVRSKIKRRKFQHLMNPRTTVRFRDRDSNRGDPLVMRV